jgi:hypothetical protein
MSKSAKPSLKPPLTREELMDERAAADFAKMDRVNSDKSIEFKIMNERDLTNPLAPKPSEKNSAGQAVNLFDLTFSQTGEARFGNSAYMHSRRRF